MFNLLSPPTFASEDMTERAATFFKLAWAMLITVAVILSASILIQPNLLASAATILVVMAVPCGLFPEFNRHGRTREASWLLVGVTVLIVTTRSFYDEWQNLSHYIWQIQPAATSH